MKATTLCHQCYCVPCQCDRDPLPPPTYAIVGCGKQKADGRQPAKAKYTSGYFQTGKRAYAEQFCDAWWVLSGKYGVVPPDKQLPDYDQTATDPEFPSARWYRCVRDSLAACPELQTADDTAILDVLVGQPYLTVQPHTTAMTVQELFADLPVVTRFPFEPSSGNGAQHGWLQACCTRNTYLDPNTYYDSNAAAADANQPALDEFLD